jgi:hypothetical protein
MSNKLKFYLLSGPVLVSFIFALTSPIIQIYFVSRVSTEIFAAANMLSTGLAALVNSSVAVDRIMRWYKKHFYSIVIIDLLCFCIVSFLSTEYITVRFLGLAVLNAVSTNLWYVLMRNAVNNIIKGDNLTKWESFESAWNLGGQFFGAALAIYFIDIPLELCIGLQCIANIIMGTTDYKAWNMIWKGKDTKI